MNNKEPGTGNYAQLDFTNVQEFEGVGEQDIPSLKNVAAMIAELRRDQKDSMDTVKHEIVGLGDKIQKMEEAMEERADAQEKACKNDMEEVVEEVSAEFDLARKRTAWTVNNLVKMEKALITEFGRLSEINNLFFKKLHSLAEQVKEAAQGQGDDQDEQGPDDAMAQVAEEEEEEEAMEESAPVDSPVRGRTLERGNRRREARADVASKKRSYSEIASDEGSTRPAKRPFLGRPDDDKEHQEADE